MSWIAVGVVGCAAPPEPPPLPPVWIEPLTGMDLALVEPGVFEMGVARPPDDLRPAPVHEVRLTRPYYLGRHEVTQAQWRRVMGTSPSRFPDCDDCPVETVSWLDVQAFLERLAAAEPGEHLRLPTEAEWEYACRSGAGGRYGGDVDTLRPDLANYDARIPFDGVALDRFVGHPRPVGSYPPNPWGFYDLAGNVWEWTADEYCPYAAGPSTDPVGRCGTDTIPIRGGSWYFSANAARCGRRYTHARADEGFSLGFRLLREVGED